MLEMFCLRSDKTKDAVTILIRYFTGMLTSKTGKRKWQQLKMTKQKLCHYLYIVNIDKNKIILSKLLEF
jgi:hypothetical protein